MNSEARQITITPVNPDEKPILANLLGLYLHDLSDFTTELDITPDGRFEYDSLDLYFAKETLHPYFIKLNGALAGFVLLNRPPYAPKDVDYYVNEYFILRKYRGQGVGKAAIREVFAQHPGRYAIAQMTTNLPALHFWRTLYAQLGLNYEEEERLLGEDPCIMQKFTISVRDLFA